ncbi:UDP-N-acetyl-D-glucosamine dehydrogenase [bacterium]|nr:UDP-N-acetyl-D-glucosamine dehydrogenase [bacterium]
MNPAQKEQLKLLSLLKSKEAKIGIVGLGYVGLPLALAFVKKGYFVLGLDIDNEKIELIQQGVSYINHIKNDTISNSVSSGNFQVSTDFSKSKSIDALILCVPTPLSKNREPDLSYILATLESLKQYMHPGQALSLESTTYPGTTEDVIKPFVESTGLKVGRNFFLMYSPEREDPGNKKFNTTNIPKILGASSDQCKEVGVALYEQVIDKVVTVSNTQTAEMTKLIENIHRSVNIGLVNEMKPLAEKMGIDLFEVIRAAATKPFGFVPYYPGPGIGGHCIPIDPFYLTWKAREYGMHTRFIELAGEINAQMPNYVLQKISDSLNSLSIALKNSNILILGIAYKKNVGDLRESPSIQLMELLLEKEANIQYSDPYANSFPKMRNHSFNLKSINITKENLLNQDVVVLATDHDSFDYDLITKYSKLIIDTRGRFEPSNKIIRA